MRTEQWDRIQDLFCAAVEMPTSARADYLRRECGHDVTLRTSVEQLLRHDEQADEEEYLAPLSVNVKVHVLPTLPDDPILDEQLGPFRIDRLIGAGGMGNVYLGVRTTGFEQRVAVKVLKRGMDSDEILRRFRTEIQVLASLASHPNICGLVDAGLTAAGQPFFVMEYVEGQRLDEYCDERRLDTDERIRLVRSLAEAVHFAHRHGVIHRDLKMSNLLVTNEGVPKLIDFGIAKLTSPNSDGRTRTRTNTADRFLTPEYASPEQVRGEPLTASSDVYSLGVVLCELLTGERPTANAVGQSPARHLRADLDTILKKTLEPDLARRYSSMEAFASDLTRHLAGEPIEARPPGTLERTWNTVRRHPIPFILFAAVLLGLVLGLGHLSRLTESLVRMSALESAAQQARVLTEAQDFYSKAVVGDLDAPLVPFDHPYRKQPGKILVPATFTKELGRVITEKSPSGMAAKLYSDRPFPHVPSEPLDAFERDALAHLRRNPDQPFSRFEIYRGRISLRYAVARTLKQDCLKCHNNVNERFHDAPGPSNDPDSRWQVGDVRGVLQIVRPLDKDYERIEQGTRKTVHLVIGTSAVGFGLALVLLVWKRRK